MTNSRLHAAIALGSVFIVGACVFFLPSVLLVSERSQASRMCREEGIGQASKLHEVCLAQRSEHWNGKTTGSPTGTLSWWLTRTRRVYGLDSSPKRTSSALALTTSPTRAV